MSVVATKESVRRSVLFVDDSNLLRGILKEELEAKGFELHLAENGPPALDMARDLLPDVVVLDFGIPGMNGYDVCCQMKAHAATTEIPVLMITALKDAYTHDHSLRVARMSLIVAQEHGMPREDLEPLLLSAILHDVGKIGIPDNILKKPGRLTKAEFEIMKGHPAAGAKMLEHIPALENVIPGILHHHEYWNGSGYPHGLAGEDIPLQGRIIHIGDAFDAMTTDRVYRTKTDVSGAVAELRKLSGKQFDPSLVECFLQANLSGRVHDGMPTSTPSIEELIDRIR